ncbi:MAG: bifunctional protein-serine/threonine kinase/phosphatase, partial [Thiomicrorhabdus sp.]|nr:bifunctional protein-serine/threonine kinase/phosphatase [Thiomicrorhabdus sp.]
MSNQLKINIGLYSSAGVKPENQDSLNHYTPTDESLESKGIVTVLADGVSTSEAAKQASQTAVTSFISDYY